MASSKTAETSKALKVTKPRIGSHYIFSLLFVILGVILIFASVRNNSTKLSSKPAVAPTQNQILQQALKPAKIYIPKIAKVLSVSDGEVIDNRWRVSATGVSYLLSSALPGESGNSVIYGHNRKDILGSLPRVAKDDLIYVVLQNGQVVKYRVFETGQISPTQVEILKDFQDSRLTIYTCSGFLDTARFVVVAKLDESSS